MAHNDKFTTAQVIEALRKTRGLVSLAARRCTAYLYALTLQRRLTRLNRFLDPSARERLTVPILPFSEIDRRGAGMYKGQSRAASIDGDAPGVQPGEGGSTPTAALQTNPESHE